MATKVLTDPQHYTNIANAIREKNGTSNTYTPANMADAILAIESGGGGSGSSTMVVTSVRAYLPTLKKAQVSNVFDVSVVASAVGGIKE